MHFHTSAPSDIRPRLTTEPQIDGSLASSVTFTLELVSELSVLGAMWRELENRADVSFFQSWNWIGSWLEEAGIRPWVLVGRASERIVAIGVLQPSRQHRHLVVKTNALLLHELGSRDKDILTIAYNGFLIDRDYGWQLVQRAMAFVFGVNCSATVRRNGGFDFDELHLRGVPALYGRYARTSGIRQVVISKYPSWRVDLEKLRVSKRGYLETLSTNTRYQIRRTTRLYEALGQITAKRADNLEEALAFYKAMKEISTAYWLRRGKIGSFAYPFFDHFHQRLIRNCIVAGTVELIRMTSGDRIIGYLYNLIYRGWVYAYQCAFVFEGDSKYKPGLLAHSLCIQQHLRLGDAVYDFLPGYSRYKTNLGTRGLEMLDIVLQRPTVTLTAEHYLRQVKRAVSNRLAKQSIVDSETL